MDKDTARKAFASVHRKTWVLLVVVICVDVPLLTWLIASGH